MFCEILNYAEGIFNSYSNILQNVKKVGKLKIPKMDLLFRWVPPTGNKCHFHVRTEAAVEHYL
jgi:hypothetical protein